MLNFFEKASKAVSDIVQQPDEQQRQGQEHDSNRGVADSNAQSTRGGHATPAGTSQGGEDLLTNLVGVAKNVVENLGGDQTRHGASGSQGTNAGDVEESVSKMDSQGGKVQISSTTGFKSTETEKQSSQSSDFLKGVIGVVQDVAGKFQEGTAKGQASESHVAYTGDIEESVSKVDSQGGKVQISSIVGEKTVETEKPAPSSDFLKGVMGVVSDVAGKLQEGASKGVDTTKSAAGSAADASKEQYDQLAKGISGLVGGFLGGKTDDKQEAPAPTKDFDKAPGVDAAKEQPSSDFLKGVMGVVSDVAGKIQEGASKGADTTKSAASGAADVSKEQLDQLTKGISGLVGGFLGGKADDKKEGAPSTVTVFDKTPVVDDVEGEIVVQKTKGFTAVDSALGEAASASASTAASSGSLGNAATNFEKK